MGEFVLEPTDMWEFQEETTVEVIEPVVDAWSTYFENTRCKVIEFIYRHDYTENRKLDTRVTVDGVTYTSANVDKANNDDFWMGFNLQNRLRVLSDDIAPRAFNLLDMPLTGKEIKIEMRARETFGIGGAKLMSFVQWEKLG